MKGIFKIDIFLISLGLAVLIAQRFFLSPAEGQAEEGTEVSANRLLATAEVQPKAARASEWVLTFPEESKYESLVPPAGVEPNPFLEVQRIADALGAVRDYAGKDTDMRQLLLAHAGKDYLFVLQQQAANEMLRHELFQHYYSDPTHPGMLEGIAFYTDQLHKSHSEDAKLMYMCLRALKNHWPAERIAEVAASVAARVKARPISSAADTATVYGYHRQVYARELQKLALRLRGKA